MPKMRFWKTDWFLGAIVALGVLAVARTDLRYGKLAALQFLRLAESIDRGGEHGRGDLCHDITV